MQVQSLSWEDPLEEEMASYSSVLACKIPQTEEPGGLQSMGSQSQTRLKRRGIHVFQLLYQVGTQLLSLSTGMSIFSHNCYGIMRDDIDLSQALWPDWFESNPSLIVYKQGDLGQTA